jgi:type 1 fimbriae regulatory protein FimB/type 1 fimbriae regulatory protein FimE
MPLRLWAFGRRSDLVEAAKVNRHGQRDSTMILLAWAAEVCDLRWDQVELNAAVLHVRRVKNGTPSTHPLIGDEMRALRRLQRESHCRQDRCATRTWMPAMGGAGAKVIEAPGVRAA